LRAADQPRRSGSGRCSGLDSRSDCRPAGLRNSCRPSLPARRAAALRHLQAPAGVMLGEQSARLPLPPRPHQRHPTRSRPAEEPVRPRGPDPGPGHARRPMARPYPQRTGQVTDLRTRARHPATRRQREGEVLHRLGSFLQEMGHRRYECSTSQKAGKIGGGGARPPPPFPTGHGQSGSVLSIVRSGPGPGRTRQRSRCPTRSRGYRSRWR
jgi:hypothetical protein